MNENPFESKGKSQNSFETKKQNSGALKPVVIIIAIIIVIGIIGKIAVDKYHENQLEQSIESLFDGDISLEDIKKSNQSFIGPDSLLGSGEQITINAKAATTEVEGTSFMDSGSTYYYDQSIEPGVYTVKFKAGDDVVFGATKSFATIGYQLGSIREGSVMNEFYNVAINGDEELFIEASNNDFEIEFIPQDQYVEFDPTDIQPGVYVAGQSIESGKYNFESTTDELSVINYQTEEQVKLIDNEEYPTFKLNDGESIVIDDENTILNKA